MFGDDYIRFRTPFKTNFIMPIITCLWTLLRFFTKNRLYFFISFELRRWYGIFNNLGNLQKSNRFDWLTPTIFLNLTKMTCY